ncbi:MAG: glutamate formimidoyltransferase [Armatimonadetes bacterium]|nr:glutamate formimidoyltransferase [Armatimonadota bacterium]
MTQHPTPSTQHPAPTKIVQCVPNFSEGRRVGVVRSIVEAAASAGPAKVVDYSYDPDHNRSVITVVGEPDAVKAAVLAGAAKAVDLIDMNEHKGEHPRVGAVDVVPVVPVLGCTMAECVSLSYEIGKELAEKLEIPVYFYEQSANMSHRTNLADIRRGGYEALKLSGLTGDWEPDLGPRKPHPTAGATVVGARGPLIAYNINLKTDDVSVARKIARKIRMVRDEGKGLTGVKALGVHLKSRCLAQVSTNITQPHAASIYEVFRFVEDEARKLGVQVLESEIIGALHQEAIIEALCEAIKLPRLHESRVLDSWLRK